MEKPAKLMKEAKDEKQKDPKLEEQLQKEEEEKTPDGKLQHVESERAHRRLRQEQKAQEKQLENILREKENLQREYNKSVLKNDKLQEVCREQQKLIKSVKNESMQKIREEEERRKESQSKFQASLNDITQSLSKNNDENLKLRDHNIEMTKKLKQLAEQYQLREKQLEKLNEQVNIESQLYQAKLKKAEVQSAMEKEILVKEKQIALEKLYQSQSMIKELSERELSLKEQLNLYTAKYDDFKSSLQKSNDIFITYKVELDKMAKNTKKLEKEALEWQRKYEKSNATLIGLATEKRERDEHSTRCTKQVEQLQKLLRALQAERTHLYKVLRENNIECPAMPALPPEPEPLKTVAVLPSSGGDGGSSIDTDKMEVMTRNCAELKQTLAHLQDQMKYLNLKGNDTETTPVAREEEGPKKRQKKRATKNKRAAKCANEEDASTASTLIAATTNNCPTKKDTQPEATAVVETEANNSSNGAEAVEVDSAPATPAIEADPPQPEVVPEAVPEVGSETVKETVTVIVLEVSAIDDPAPIDPTAVEEQQSIVETDDVDGSSVEVANEVNDATITAIIEPVPVQAV